MPDGSPWARWSVFGLVDGWLTLDEDRLTYQPCAKAGDDLRVAARGEELLPAMFDAMAAVARRSDAVADQDAPSPFGPGWIGGLSYDLGRFIEPAASGAHRPGRDRPWPLAVFARVSSLLIHDAESDRWLASDDRAAALLDRAASTAVHELAALDSPYIGEISPNRSRESHIDAVAAAREHIARGDIFQANVTMRLAAPFRGSPRRFAHAAMETARPRYGACIELPAGRTAVSISPELFLQLDGSAGDVITRPIKGTRPAGDHPDRLARSEKDAAELAMIVDLMRNDLGRVCRFGSVRVSDPRILETHRTVHHTAGEVRGRLRDGLGPRDLLQAAFPPGSVTGAPKIRAMQIIDELETARREWYCGSIGFLGDDGAASLNVAIRTAMLTDHASSDADSSSDAPRWGRIDGVLDYHVGGGIVADSDPAAEYEEAVTKSHALLATVAALRAGDGAADPSRSDPSTGQPPASPALAAH